MLQGAAAAPLKPLQWGWREEGGKSLSAAGGGGRKAFNGCTQCPIFLHISGINMIQQGYTVYNTVYMYGEGYWYKPSTKCHRIATRRGAVTTLNSFVQHIILALHLNEATLTVVSSCGQELMKIP